MTFEWLVFVLVLALAATLGGVRGGWRGALAALALAGATVAGAVLWSSGIRERETARRAALAGLPREGRPGGYVSSDSCRACHPKEYRSWHDSYHRTMTQYA